MLLTALFQNQILDDLFLDNSAFNFILRVKLVSCHFSYLLYDLTFILYFIRNFYWKKKMSLTQDLLPMSLVLKTSFNG